MTTEKNSQSSIPPWILYYVVFLTILSAYTSVMGYFSPENIFVGQKINFEQAKPVVFFYATRNVGILVLCLFGLLKRDISVLCSMLLLRFVVESLDLFSTVKFGIGDFHPAVLILTWIAVFLVPEFLALRSLYRLAFVTKAREQ